MKTRFLAALVALACLPRPAAAQVFDVRRMAMGGAILGGRQGGEGANVAYHALPRVRALRSVSLPIGVLPLLQDPPSFDPRNPDFNVFRLANLVENPPWNLPLVQVATPSNDVSLDVSRNSLTVDLGDLGKVFPSGPVRAYGVTNGPSIGLSIRRVFVGLAPLVEFENTLDLDEPLRSVLRDGDSLAANTRYSVSDAGRAQAAAALHVGTALPLWRAGDPARPSAAVYAGTRFKLLRGLAYGQADNVAAYDTGDTLFANSSLDLRYTGRFLDATPAHGGWGEGVDVGALWTVGGLELGLAANDLATRIAWKVRETVATRDSATGDVKQQTVAEDVPFTSRVQASMVGNAAFRAGRWTLAADVRHNTLATTAHAGIERWAGPLALRAGGGMDANRRAQASGGLGIALGRVALDAAVATHNRNLENQREVELGVGLEVLP